MGTLPLYDLRPLLDEVPNPDRILDYTGHAFIVGAGTSSVFHFLKSTYNSPKGLRLTRGFEAVRMNAPRGGGSLAIWGCAYSTFNCTIGYLRQKEDPWNSILGAFVAGGFCSMREGLGAASMHAALIGIGFAIFEGADIMTTKLLANSSANGRSNTSKH